MLDEEPGSTLVKHVKVKVSDTPGSTAVYGVFLGYSNDGIPQKPVGVGFRWKGDL